MSAAKQSPLHLRILLTLPFSLLLFASRGALAQQPPGNHPIHVRTEVGTDLPLDVAARISGELPHRIRFSTSLGYLPSAYVDAMNGILTGMKAYDDKTAALVRSSLRESAILRIHTGWRPWASSGFYIDGGYGVLALGGGTSAADVITNVVRRPLPVPNASDKTFRIKSVVHMIDIEFGWEWLIAERATARVAIGGAFTVGSTTQIRPQFDAGPYEMTLQAYCDDASGRLDHILRNYVFTPVVSFSGGFALF